MMDTIVCEACGQSNKLTARTQFCSFCYQRFPESEAPEENPEAAAENSSEQPEKAAEGTQTEAETQASETVSEKTSEAEAEKTSKQPELMTTICPHCVSDVPAGLELCPNCNQNLSESWL